MNQMEGVYLPLVTPFHDGAIDLESLRRLVEHYRNTGLAGLVMLGTTGEVPTVEPAEQRAVVAATLDAVAGELPVYVGVGGNSTKHVASALAGYESMDVAGYLVVTPYYNRPSADGLIEHFRAVAGRPGGPSSPTTCRTAPASTSPTTPFSNSPRRCRTSGR